MRKLTHLELLSRQDTQPKRRLPFCVVLNNVRSLYNVGSIFRTADGVGLEKIWLCGITGYPPESKISKTALGAEKEVPWEYVASSKACVSRLRAQGYQVVFLEQMEGSASYQDFIPKSPVCLVLGNELWGVGEGLLPHGDVAIEITMAGLKNSLNVTVAFGIIAYHIRNQMVASAAWQAKSCS